MQIKHRLCSKTHPAKAVPAVDCAVVVMTAVATATPTTTTPPAAEAKALTGTTFFNSPLSSIFSVVESAVVVLPLPMAPNIATVVVSVMISSDVSSSVVTLAVVVVAVVVEVVVVTIFLLVVAIVVFLVRRVYITTRWWWEKQHMSGASFIKPGKCTSNYAVYWSQLIATILD